MTGQPTTPAPLRQPFAPSDEAARRVITGNLDDTLFVEASAGTGKTTSLVQRIVNLVVTGRTTMDRVAAITFTEAAAAELRDRVREYLERGALDPERPDGERELCSRGAEDLDQANIRTLHAFAAQLLHERPLDAELPPGFETSDEIVAGIAFDEAWSDWLNVVLEADSPIAGDLAMALSEGVTLDNLKKLAEAFHKNYADLNEKGFAVPVATAGASVEALRRQWPEAERLCQFSKIGEGDPLYDHVVVRTAAVQAVLGTGPGTTANYHQLGKLCPIRCRNGRVENWEVESSTGVNGCTALKAVLLALDHVITEELEQASERAFANILNAVQGFVLDYAASRRREGRAEFQDLLVWARDLLRDNLEVRDHFRRRFSHLLIDESQDTDPIQAEIAMFIAEDVPSGASEADRPKSWDQVTPARGKLFVVGDPKQSIYRFRRADVDQMYRLQERMASAGGVTEKLVQNFRSQRPVIDWVNNVFSGWMGADGDEATKSQAPYESMTHLWSASAEGDKGPRVWALGNEDMDETIEPVRRQEANELGALLKQIVSEGWLMLDPDASSPNEGEVYRPVKFSDICILIPRRTSLPSLERGLEAFDIPYRLESASLIFKSQEVQDLLNCLRAIDNPADRIATVAALRSPAFGCSDVDLLRHYEAGGQFDYLA
ncbi:MAG: UvrD-helicase domain-containing protein, partial [Chloroflexota bacterium]|nr:UvrD-helicase domain-containing protein [Chloroflexota bacterium]